MPSYWRVAPRFWTDPVMRRADDDTRMLALYLLTCPHRNVIGLYWLPKTYLCADLGWDTKRLGKPFGQLLSAGFHAYDEEAEVVLIRNALKYQAPENPNQVEAALRHIEELPPTFLASEFRGLAERFCQRLAKALPDGFGQPSPEPTAPTTATTPATATEEVVVSDADVLAIRPDVDKLCNLLADAIQHNTGKRPTVGKRWHEACRMLLDTDDYSAQQVEQMIRWCQADEFWRTNILSMSKLREKRLTLIGQMQRTRTRQQQQRDQLVETEEYMQRWASDRMRERGEHGERAGMASPEQTPQPQLPRPGTAT